MAISKAVRFSGTGTLNHHDFSQAMFISGKVLVLLVPAITPAVKI